MKAVITALISGIVGCACVQPVSAADAVKFKEGIFYSFCSQAMCADGSYPLAGLVDVKGILYGTTAQGGTGYGCGGDFYGCGAVYTLDPKTGAEKVLFSFCVPGYCATGAGPQVGLIDVKGTLYGATAAGGAYGAGTVFAFDPGSGVESVVYSFGSNPKDGTQPLADLIEVKGVLYGTTAYGGSGYYPEGTVFAVDPKTGTETVLYSFCPQQNCTDGMVPESALIDVRGTLYGTTYSGGAIGYGTVFSLNPATGSEQVVYSFTGKRGTVVSIDPTTSAEKVLYSFCAKRNCKDGANPYSGLIDVKGALYSTTMNGGISDCGPYGCGTVFSIDPGTGAEGVIHAFCSRQQTCTDGVGPYAASLVDVNGTLYGTTEHGGANNGGTVFTLKQKR